MKSEYQSLTGVELTDSFNDKKKLYHYELLREQYTFEQLRDMRGSLSIRNSRRVSDWRYKIADMDESVIVAHIKQINDKNGYPSYKQQFKKQAQSIMKKYERGQIRNALHRAENMKLDNEISFTFIERLINDG